MPLSGCGHDDDATGVVGLDDAFYFLKLPGVRQGSATEFAYFEQKNHLKQVKMQISVRIIL